MPYLNLFDEIASIGAKFLKSTDRGHKLLLDYSWQLASICDLIKHTHSIVIRKLEALDQAETIEDATIITQQLSGASLSNSFRANGLCDVFMGYGKSLRGITERYQFTGDPDNQPPITKEEQFRWSEFCDSLEERERRVAELYTSQIQGLQELVYGTDGGDLTKVKEHARQAKAILTDQVADFDSLATRFRKQIRD